jgi:hypothetical protein
MICSSCGEENRDTAKFCLGCGHGFAAVCSGCGAQLPPVARFCDECGTSLGVSGVGDQGPGETQANLDTRHPTRTPAGYSLDRPVSEVVIPNTIQDVIMAHIDRLGDEPKRAIQTASVIGREFAVRLLQRASEFGNRVTPLVGELRAPELIYTGLQELNQWTH